MTVKATFRVVHFTKCDRYVAMAWNYDEAVLISTVPHPTYTEARQDLQETAASLGVELQWFDGSYRCGGEGYPILSIASELA